MDDAAYNEIDPFAAAWLERLIERGLIAPGRVDRRSIADLTAADVAGPGQRHFFAGIGGWSYALRLAGVPDDASIWTGSCPCQPLSDAGKRLGARDARHLWPTWFELIRECRPAAVFGEQVASKLGLQWLDLVRADLERCGYAFGASDLCAAGVGAPHIRQRLHFVAVADRERLEGIGLRILAGGSRSRSPEIGGVARLVGDAGSARSGRYTGAVSDAEAQGEGERAWARRLLDESRRAGADRRCTNCGAVHRIGTQCGWVGNTTLDEFSRSARCRELAGEEAEGATWIDGDHRAEHAGSTDGLANGNGTRCPRSDEGAECAGRHGARPDGSASFWSPVEWRPCTDGKARPTEPGLEPLAHGVSGRMVVRRTVESTGSTHEEEHWYNRCGALVGFGNAIVPQVAAAFIEAAFDAIAEGFGVK